MSTNLIHTHKQELKDLVFAMQGLRAVVIGDTMLDHYVRGNVHRISPEAPVPVVQHNSEEFRLGGAANVLNNLNSLGAEAVLCSVIGSDEAGDLCLERLRQISPDTSAIMQSLTRPTSIKTRIIGNGQQMLRIDKEWTSDILEEETNVLLAKTKAVIERFHPDVLIFEDYDKGVITEKLIIGLTAFAKERNIPVAVDPKHRNFLGYHGVNLIKPNFKELCDIVPFQVEKTVASLSKATAYLREQLGHQMTLVTLSEHGVWLDDSFGGKLYNTRKIQVADVSGAGDSVMSVVALAFCLTKQPELIASLANLVGGQVCEQPGVVTINLESLISEISSV
jgi:D-glycero-beta-D-manno-heptose-7-phosphate kinase